MSSKSAVMICGHGSRDEGAVSEFNAMVATMRDTRLTDYEVESGFLEFAHPILREGFEKLKAKGHKQILSLPGMLFAAAHVKNDLPSEVNAFAQANPDMDVRFGRDLAIDPKLLRAAADRIEQALAASDKDIAREDTLLVVVGRGTNDPDANSNVSKVARMLLEGLGLGWAEVAYSGVAHPRVNACLRHVTRLGYQRIVVFPYFLFTGILVRRIYGHVDEVAAEYPAIDFLKAPYLKDHPLVLDTFADRVREMLDGGNDMNCQLCKYREQIIGYEEEVGTPQEGHHHHVMGIGTGGEAAAYKGDQPAHTQSNGDGHGHGHAHHHHHHHHHHGVSHDHSHADPSRRALRG